MYIWAVGLSFDRQATPYFSCCLCRDSGSRDPNVRKTPHPVFRGAGGRRSNPSARCSPYVPTTVSNELATAEISASVWSLYFNHNSSLWRFFTTFFSFVVAFFVSRAATFNGGVKSTCRRGRLTQVFLLHALRLRGNGLISAFFLPLPSLPSPVDLRLEQVERGKKTLPPTCDSPFLQLRVLPGCHFKRACCQMFLHILAL